MMLRAVEEKRFLPVGSDKEVTSDFQLLAGTNKDLAEEVVKGNFREDLLARLNLWTYYLPRLKDRREDIEPNVDYELHKYSEENAQNITFNKEARAKYVKFSLSGQAVWSANFCNLSASINRMAPLAGGMYPGGRRGGLNQTPAYILACLTQRSNSYDIACLVQRKLMQSTYLIKFN